MRFCAVVAAVLAGLFFASAARAAQAPERNAALDYLRAILMSQDKDALFEDARAALDQMHPEPDSEREPVDSPDSLVPAGRWRWLWRLRRGC